MQKMIYAEAAFRCLEQRNKKWMNHRYPAFNATATYKDNATSCRGIFFSDYRIQEYCYVITVQYTVLIILTFVFDCLSH